MSHWFNSAEHQLLLWKMCNEHTPATMLFEDDPDYKLNCIPVSFSGDEYCVIVDQDDDGYGVKRGEKIYGDPDEIADVIVREKRSEE